MKRNNGPFEAIFMTTWWLNEKDPLASQVFLSIFEPFVDLKLSRQSCQKLITHSSDEIWIKTQSFLDEDRLVFPQRSSLIWNLDWQSTKDLRETYLCIHETYNRNSLFTKAIKHLLKLLLKPAMSKTWKNAIRAMFAHIVPLPITWFFRKHGIWVFHDDCPLVKRKPRHISHG